MFRVEKKLRYKRLLDAGHILGFLHTHARRWPKRDAVYLADVEALLHLWEKIGQTPRFTDQRRLIHLFDSRRA